VTPTGDTDAVRKSYVDDELGLSPNGDRFLAACEAASDSNEKLSGIEAAGASQFSDTHSFINLPYAAVPSYDPSWTINEWVGYVLVNNSTGDYGLIVENDVQVVSGDAADFPSEFTIGDSFSICTAVSREIDGRTLSANDRILLAGQADRTKNGVWLAQVGGWTRPDDFNDDKEASGTIVPMRSGGDRFGLKRFLCIADSYPLIVGTSVFDCKTLTRDIIRVNVSSTPGVADFFEGELTATDDVGYPQFTVMMNYALYYFNWVAL
jgi:hypothetical protein